MNDADTTIETIRARLRAFRDARDWEKFHRPRDLALAIGSEAGELAELFLWATDDEVAARVEGDAAFREQIGDEVADILIYLMYLAESVGIDVAAAVEAKVGRNERRFPPRPDAEETIAE